MENGRGVEAEDGLLVKVVGQEVDLPRHPGFRQPDQLRGQIQLVGGSWGESVSHLQAMITASEAFHCMNPSLCNLGPNDAPWGSMWTCFNPFLKNNIFQDAQKELCRDWGRDCNTFEMGFIPTAFIIFYFAVTQSKALLNADMIRLFQGAPLFGFLGDRYSRKILMAAGIAIWSVETCSSL